MLKNYTQQEIERRVYFSKLMEDFKSTLKGGLRKKATTPQRIMISEDNPYSVFGVMPCLSKDLGLFCTKIATLVDNKDEHHQGPTIQAQIMVFSTKTGDCLGVFDGNTITNLKCQAITAVVTDVCARSEAKTLGVIGTDTLALQQIKGISAVRDLKSIVIYGRREAGVQALIDKIKDFLPSSIEIRGTTRMEESVCKQEIVCTATTSYLPLIKENDFHPFVHINCMGSHRPESREIANDILSTMPLIVEDLPTALLEAGKSHEKAKELEEVLGDAPLLQKFKQQQTLFASVGHGFLDTLVIDHVLANLKEKPS